MRKEFLLVVVGILGLAALLYFLSPLSHHPENEAPIQAQEEVPVPEEAPPEVSTEPVVTAPTPTPAPPPPSDTPAPLNPETMKMFANKLREMGTCLETSNNVPGEELEPNLQTLVDSVRGEWGESVINAEDWRQIELETPEGEKRRIRVEMDFDSDTIVQRKLKYMTVLPDGQTSQIPVPEDQAIEPSDSLIASLEAGNHVLAQEKFERIYFSNGEEIVAKQKDGFLTEIEINKGPKSFKCSSVNSSQPNCQCLQ